MPEAINTPVVLSLYFSVFFGWDNRRHALLFCLLNNGICIIATISKKIFGIYSLN